jgi:hypothetical protein
LLLPVLKQLLKRHWVAMLLLPVASLFFVGGPDALAGHTARYIWNLGHIVFFAVATYAFSKIKPFQSTLGVFSYFVGVLILSFFIEGIQNSLGRSFSTMDILRNLVGCAIALFFVARPFLHISALSFLTLILAFDLTGFATTIWTDTHIQQRKPIVEDFESGLVFMRWNDDIEQSEQHVFAGQYSAKVSFSVQKYSGTGLDFMLKDWTGFSTFELHIFNPGVAEEILTIRLEDGTHRMSLDQDYQDRFNRSFVLKTGWNTLNIPIDDIEYAPNNRDMNLNDMHQIILFMSDVQKPKVLFMDQFVLR